MGNIEKQGTGWLSSTVAESKILEPYFKENDRTPSFDGYIFVYDGSLKKKDLKEHIPVQIKSIMVDTFSSDSRSYSLSMSDIQNYYKIRGTILFVVEICGKERKGFIKSLLPSELKNILAELELKKSKNPSKALHLAELDTSTLNELENICEHFLIHRKLQFSTIEHSLSITDASEIEIPIIFDRKRSKEYLFSKEHLLYGKQANETVLRYIQNAQITSISQSLSRDIKINSKTYFSQYSETLVPNGKFLEFGNKIRIDFHDIGTGKLSYELTGTLSEQIKVLSFLLDLYKIGVAHISGGKLEINNTENDADFLNSVKSILKYLKDVEALLNSFRVDPDRLNIASLENRDFANLDYLLDVFVHKRRKESTPLQRGFNMVRVGNISLGVFVYKKKDDPSYTFFDLFGKHDDLEFQSQLIGGNLFASSMYVILKQDFLTLVDNLDLSIVLKDIKKVAYSTEYGQVVTIFGLELIKAYDASGRGEFLDAAFSIFEWLQQMDRDLLLHKLNELQIIRRQRAYTKDEKAFLIQEKAKNTGNCRILCGINVLLENKSDAEFNFDQLTEKEKEEFIQFPIFTLAKKLDMFKNNVF